MVSVTIITNTENKNQRQQKICELQHPSVLSAFTSRKKKEKMPMKCREISDDDNKRRKN